MTLRELINDMQSDREERNICPTYVPARALFTECIKLFGQDYPSAYEIMALVQAGSVSIHETIGGYAFSIAGIGIKYNVKYGELI